VARRPVFIPARLGSTYLTDEVEVEFEWSPGFAVSQKQKSIRALHDAAFEAGISPVLEVSTKSPEPLGVKLSAFNLRLDMEGRGIPLEAAFQGSKVFEQGGPYVDIYELHGPAIKRDERLHNSGQLTAFEWHGERWPLVPKTSFYDWLYLNAVNLLEEAAELARFAGFTDIEFNPAKSINCQARSCALYVALQAREVLREVLAGSPQEFRRLLGGSQADQGSQHSLF
jgi:hypothetical protein